MKKFLIGILVLLAVLGIGGYSWYKASYGGAAYYVKITANGQKKLVQADDGAKFDRWNYSQEAYDDKGQAHPVNFAADHNLRLQAYLKLTYNTEKGVTSWQEVSQNELPAATAKQLN